MTTRNANTSKPGAVATGRYHSGQTRCLFSSPGSDGPVELRNQSLPAPGSELLSGTAELGCLSQPADS